ncbi:unnamed protein product [Coffea canephora]|uniref:DH200=94 genomic scaffold, scaffold_538 n=1 Tax=Coffea canephora TaxID=49390 RepID=A0A068VFN0_COFCA|nr:unnamed protein product [Coffea canephora]
MEKKEGFRDATPHRILNLHTTQSHNFLGLHRDYGLWQELGYGQGLIIGILDDGIKPDHPRFSDVDVPPPPPTWKGKCDFKGFTCNNKIIGARKFVGNETGEPVDEGEHGDHTASIAAGNFVENANVFGFANGRAAGMAPHAHLAIYQVCVGSVCSNEDFLAGMEAALQDGVHLLSLSLGGMAGTRIPFYDDAIGVGAFHAIENGTFVSCSAGNSGPKNGRLSNEAPWILTVGASSIDRNLRATAILGSNKEFDGESLFQPKDFPSKHGSPTRNDSADRYRLCSKKMTKFSDSTRICTGQNHKQQLGSQTKPKRNRERKATKGCAPQLYGCCKAFSKTKQKTNREQKATKVQLYKIWSDYLEKQTEGFFNFFIVRLRLKTEVTARGEENNSGKGKAKERIKKTGRNTRLNLGAVAALKYGLLYRDRGKKLKEKLKAHKIQLWPNAAVALRFSCVFPSIFSSFFFSNYPFALFSPPSRLDNEEIEEPFGLFLQIITPESGVKLNNSDGSRRNCWYVLWPFVLCSFFVWFCKKLCNSRIAVVHSLLWPFVLFLFGLFANHAYTSSTFNIVSGTSMSCPHLIGIAALLKSMHCDWSPAEIKSAIMTTADILDRNNDSIPDEMRLPADVFAVGAGHVNPLRAADPGLVYDIKPDDYIPYLCGLGYTDKNIKKILNYPSFAIQLGNTTQTYSRTLTSVGETPSTYEVKIDSVVQPRVLYFTQEKQQLSYEISFTRILPFSDHLYRHGAITWISNKYNVRSPISVNFV